MFIYPIYNHNWRNIININIQQDWHQTKYSHRQTKYIGKYVGLRTVNENVKLLQQMLKKLDRRAWTGVMWLRIGTCVQDNLLEPEFYI